jgi:hypothetical protein
MWTDVFLFMKGARMYPRGFENAYAHEVERRKDEMRAAAKHNLERQSIQRRKTAALPKAILSILARILVIVFGK